MSVEVFELNASHRDDWQPLAEGYKAFYRTPTTAAAYDEAWRKLMAGVEVHGLGARLGKRLDETVGDGRDDACVGITHYLFHASAWAPRVCYLQDLFTAPAARGRGVARALIEAVAERARAAGATRCYWLTQDHNETARRLYDRVARFNGFIRYDLPLQPGA